MVRSGALLLVGRQGGAAAFLVALVALPRVVARPTFNEFMWAYVVQLLVSSVLSLGLERLVAGLVASSDGERRNFAVSWVLTVRILTLPLTAVAVLGGLWVVHVRLPWAAIIGVIVWTAAIQFQMVIFAVLRASKQIRIEPTAAALVRVTQAVALVLAAHIGASLSILVSVVTVPEVALAILLWCSAGIGFRLRAPNALPWRSLTRYAAIEIFGFAYLRADALVVGHILGPGPGATYSLVYRVVDGLTAMVTPFLLHLFPAAVRAVSEPGGVDRLRRSLLSRVPSIAAATSLTTMFATIGAGTIVPRLGEGRAALQILVVSIPLYAFSAIELHLQSAEGRNRAPVALGATVLTLNVALNWMLVGRYGLTAAAWVLVFCELTQAAYLARRLVCSRVIHGRDVGVAASTVGLLCVTAGLLARSQPSSAAVPGVACLALCAWPWVAHGRGRLSVIGRRPGTGKG